MTIYKIFIRFSQDQNIAGVCKLAQLAYGVCSAVRHIQLREWNGRTRQTSIKFLREETIGSHRGFMMADCLCGLSLCRDVGGNHFHRESLHAAQGWPPSWSGVIWVVFWQASLVPSRVSF